jgi:peptide/nickel transport system permease protein
MNFKLDSKSLLRFGTTLAFFYFAIAIVGHWFAPFGFDQVRSDGGRFGTLVAPNSVNLFGTTSSGFDVLSRTIFGSGTAILVAILSVALAASIGITLGLIAGLMGGVVDRSLSVVADAFFAIPSLLIALVVSFSFSSGAGSFFSSISAAIIAEGVTFSARYFRAVRVEAMTVSRSKFVDAARVSGVSWFRLLFVHVLPNSLKSSPALMIQNAADAVLTLAGLGFLGIGISANSGAEWGYDISRALSDLQAGIWWTTLFPAVAVSGLVISLMFVAEGLSDRAEARTNHGF